MKVLIWTSAAVHTANTQDSLFVSWPGASRIPADCSAALHDKQIQKQYSSCSKVRELYSITVLIPCFLIQLGPPLWCFKSIVVEYGGKMIKTGSFSTYLWSLWAMYWRNILVNIGLIWKYILFYLVKSWCGIKVLSFPDFKGCIYSKMASCFELIRAFYHF